MAGEDDSCYHTDLFQARASADVERLTCSICFGVVRDAVETVCGHVFGKKCLDTALSYKHACPNCRKDLPRNAYHASSARSREVLELPCRCRECKVDLPRLMDRFNGHGCPFVEGFSDEVTVRLQQQAERHARRRRPIGALLAEVLHAGGVVIHLLGCIAFCLLLSNGLGMVFTGRTTTVNYTISELEMPYMSIATEISSTWELIAKTAQDYNRMYDQMEKEQREWSENLTRELDRVRTRAARWANDSLVGLDAFECEKAGGWVKANLC